jgi:MoaA/NifB/PqqE/SkfB family radical SAM enzyme
MNDVSFASPYKIIHHSEKIEALRRGENIYPIQVEIHPALVCNHRCKWCITDSVKIRDYERYDYKRSKKIEFETLRALVIEFARLGVKTLTFSGGGEPLLYDGIEEILRTARSHSLEYGLITNLGLKLNDELLSSIKKATWIRVSLDAADATTHSRVHRTNERDFNIVLENIEKVARDCFVGVNYLVDYENYTGIYDCARIVKSLGTKYIRYAPVYDQRQGNQYSELWPEITEQFKRVSQLNTPEFIVFPFKDRFQNLVTNIKDYKECHIHRLHPILGADLKIYACCNFPYTRKYVVADLGNRSFEEAWNSDERKNFIKNLDPQKCPSCWYNEQNKIINYMVMEKALHKNFV